MRDIAIFDDGKLRRGIRALLIESRGKRHLITYYCHMEEKIKTQWFKRESRTDGGAYCSVKDNQWYYPKFDTEKGRTIFKDHHLSIYYETLFG